MVWTIDPNEAACQSDPFGISSVLLLRQLLELWGFSPFFSSCLQGLCCLATSSAKLEGGVSTWLLQAGICSLSNLPVNHPNNQILEMLQGSFIVSTYLLCLSGAQSCTLEAGTIFDTASLLWQGPCIARRVQLSPASHTHYCFYLHSRNNKAAWPSLLGAHTHFWGHCFDRNGLCEEGEQNLPLFLLCASQVLPYALPAAATIAGMDSFRPKYWMKYIRISALQDAIQNTSKYEMGGFKSLQGNENQEQWKK